MNDKSRQCSKCDGTMVEGFVVNLNMLLQQTPTVWMAGKREDVLNAIGWGLPDELERYYLTTYRCEQCGYLESYATTRRY